MAWSGDHVMLEERHDYIQWLFPIRESSRYNTDVDPLQYDELQSMRKCPMIRRAILESYRMMLDFYGFELTDDQTGDVELHAERFEERFEFLNQSPHNWMRITRILKSMGDFGYERFKHKWLWLIMEQMIAHQRLGNLGETMLQWWIPTLRNDAKCQRYKQLMAFHLNLATPDQEISVIRAHETNDNQDAQYMMGYHLGAFDIPTPPRT